jgi:hypothetical protein
MAFISGEGKSMSTTRWRPAGLFADHVEQLFDIVIDRIHEGNAGDYRLKEMNQMAANHPARCPPQEVKQQQDDQGRRHGLGRGRHQPICNLRLTGSDRPRKGRNCRPSDARQIRKQEIDDQPRCQQRRGRKKSDDQVAAVQAGSQMFIAPLAPQHVVTSPMG